ncbi:hypothetical protein AOLI_G00290910 [Acnodon oligacanthus]
MIGPCFAHGGPLLTRLSRSMFRLMTGEMNEPASVELDDCPDTDSVEMVSLMILDKTVWPAPDSDEDVDYQLEGSCKVTGFLRQYTEHGGCSRFIEAVVHSARYTFTYFDSPTSSTLRLSVLSETLKSSAVFWAVIPWNRYVFIAPTATSSLGRPGAGRLAMVPDPELKHTLPQHCHSHCAPCQTAKARDRGLIDQILLRVSVPIRTPDSDTSVAPAPGSAPSPPSRPRSPSLSGQSPSCSDPSGEPKPPGQ